jgi:mitogen-activated protein kinase kinase 1
MSPERIRGEPYSYSSDIWSMGIVLLAFATGDNPFQSVAGYWSMMTAIQEASVKLLPQDGYSNQLRSFISQCLQQEADKRPTAKALLQHAFIQKAIHSGTYSSVLKA